MNRRFSYLSFGLFFVCLMLISLSLILLPKGRVIYYLSAAQKMMKEGDIDGALAQAEKAIAIQPHSLPAVRMVAKVYLAGDRYDEAETTLQELISLSPNNAEAYRDLAFIRLSKKDIKGARAAVQKAISLSPETAENYHLLGVMAMEEKDYATAKTQLLKTIELAPDSYISHYLLGMIYFEQEHLPEAIDELTVVTTKDPDFAPAQSLIGMCYLKVNLYIHALTAFKKAVDLDPADYTSMYNVACVYSLEKNPDSAIKWLQRAVDNGFTDFDHMKTDSDLDNIRSLPAYLRLVERGPVHTPPKPGEVKEQVKTGPTGKG